MFQAKHTANKEINNERMKREKIEWQERNVVVISNELESIGKRVKRLRANSAHHCSTPVMALTRARYPSKL